MKTVPKNLFKAIKKHDEEHNYSLIYNAVNFNEVCCIIKNVIIKTETGILLKMKMLIRAD